MGVGHGYVAQERARSVHWKQTTASLPDEARGSAEFVRDGESWGPPLSFCLPAEHAALNLLPEVREPVMALFAELGIPWHQGVDGGPGNHLLSSQVQCANALGQMVGDADRVRRAFGPVLGVEEVLEVEPGRFMTFEYIGPEDVFGEVPGGQRVRGSRCTSIDAAFLHRSVEGRVELVLVEWKYTEHYEPRAVDRRKDAVRWRRYGDALMAPDGPVRGDVLEFDHLLDEPLYQLVRQQLLAHELEKARVLGADVVRVVHVCPPANTAFQQSLSRSEHRAVGGTVSEVWSRLLRASDRFTSLDSALFADPTITSEEYCVRYGGAGAER